MYFRFFFFKMTTLTSLFSLLEARERDWEYEISTLFFLYYQTLKRPTNKFINGYISLIR